MKHGYLLFVALLLFTLPLHSQSNGNEWINYDQQYFKLKISENGIYRIDKNTLLSAGFPVENNPKGIQLFAREKEQAIFIQGESDDTFDDQDFIEFVGYANDGWLDTLLYENDEDLLNPLYSLYNDTLYYYLSYNPNSLNNRRAITANDQNFDGYTSSEYCLVEESKSYNQFYHVGKRSNYGGITDPQYLAGEGFAKLIENPTENINISINTENRYSAANAPPSIIQSTISSANNPSSPNTSGNHHFRLRVNTNTYFDSTFFGYLSFPLSYQVNTQALSNTTQIAIETVNDIGISNDWLALGYIKFTYPHNFNFEASSFYMFKAKANSNPKLKIIFDNFVGSSPIAYSIGESSYRSAAFTDGDAFRFLIPQTVEEYFNCIVSSSEEIHSVNSIEQVNENGYFTDFGSLNLSNAFLIISHPQLMDEALEYNAYRNQSFSSLLIDINELYDQYGGGIMKHPLAIKRLVKDLIESWDEKPEYLFLMGKSISIYPVDQRNNSILYSYNLVPTIGYPPSDNLLTAGLNGTELEPAVATGRLAAKNGQTVLDYLDKVMAFEAQEPAMWMKNALHFGGGGTTYEQNTFENYLANYEDVVSDTSMGAQVYTYLKNTSTPIEIIVDEQITELINGGVSLMTFFGHANGSGFDINIDLPENYDNYGKYPLILASSCYTGNIHLNAISNSESFVLIPEKGSIAYLATVSTGIAQSLDVFNQKFYKHSFQSHYNSSIGKNVVRAIQDFPDYQISTHDFVKESTVLEMTLHGDPAIILNSFEKPDLAVEEAEVFFEPEILTADVDSFTVSIILKNLARATRQSFNVELTRHFPGSFGDSIYHKTVNGLLNYDTLQFTLASHHPISDGINTFDVLVNSLSQIDELNTFNNFVSGKELIVKSSQIVPVYPYHQSIIASPSPIISGYAGSLDPSSKNYHFQLSSVADFSSLLEEDVINQSDGVISWAPATMLQDHSVYYWRTAVEADANENNWRNSSFEYIADSTGWGQSTPAQFMKNEFDLLNYDPLINDLQFAQGSKQLNCRLYGSEHIEENEVLLDLTVVDYGGCGGGPWIFVMVFDPNTLEAWKNNYGGANPEHDFGNVVCNTRYRVEKFFAFNQTNEEQMASLYTMLTTGIPADHHILIYTYTIARFDYWDVYQPELFTLLTDWGSSNINVSVEEDHPFIFYTQKNNFSLTEEIMGVGTHDTLNLSIDLPIVGNSGKVKINSMGKTSYLSSAQWNFTGGQVGDEFELLLSQENSNTTLDSSSLSTSAPSLNINLDASNSIIGEIELRDTSNFTPQQFESIRLFYTPTGDASVNANLNYSFQSDTLTEGEDLQLIIGISNPTPHAMDSLLSRTSITNNANQLMSLNDLRLDSLSEFGEFIDTITVSTIGLSGNNQLSFELNPYDGMGVLDQPEQNRFNNKISIPFYVINDNTNPIVDVTFDGLHIMNGEIINPEPQIVVELKDNNEFLVFSELADTSNLTLFIKSPQGDLEKVSYDDPQIQLEFGNQQNNHLRVIYRPVFEVDGEYRMIVQAKDKSGNVSGTKNYEIEFEIIRKPAITQVLNYPNPFVDKTHFVFTLTGTRLPDEFTIRIYTVSGRIVKEIHKNELGTLRIGHNITDYYWDGTDMYGDRLANGVYFYRVTIGFYDDSIDHIETEADKFFKEGMGKMYLMR